jgi:hypothetical protein
MPGRETHHRSIGQKRVSSRLRADTNERQFECQAPPRELKRRGAVSETSRNCVWRAREKSTSGGKRVTQHILADSDLERGLVLKNQKAVRKGQEIGSE